MAAPRIRPLDHWNPGPATGRPGGPIRFVVDRPGEFLGRAYRKGDVLVVAGRGRVGDAVVLGARGLGRPRLGTLTADGLRGEAGERCSPARWTVVGRVIRVERAAGAVSRRSRGPEVGGQLCLSWAPRQAA